MKRRNKGITLIALVITIIVLLILAGVAISTLTGDNGILTKAAQAKKDTEKASTKERIQIEVMASYGENGTLDVDTLKSNISAHIPEATVEGDTFPITVTVDGQTFTVDVDGNVEAAGPTAVISDIKLLDSTGAEVTEANRPEEGATGYQASFKVTLTEAGTINSVTFNGTTITGENGVYKIPVTENTTYKISVNYTVDGTTDTKERNVVIKDLFISAAPIEPGDIATDPDTFKKVTEGKVLNYGNTLKVTDAEGNQVDLDVEWKVFYAEGNDIYLIASDYVPVSKLASQKTSLGFTDNGNYNIYWSSSNDFKVTSIDTAIANRFMLNQEATFTKSNNNYKMTACLLDASKWETFRDTRWADANNVIGSPTLEMWIASWNKKYTTETNTADKLYCNKASSTGYYVGTTNEPTSTYIGSDVMSAKAGYQDELYYPHRSGYNNCYGYWLASPSADDSSYEMYVGCSGHVNYYGYNANYYGVRPLVHLKSGVKVKPQGKDFVLVAE